MTDPLLQSGWMPARLAAKRWCSQGSIPRGVRPVPRRSRRILREMGLAGKPRKWGGKATGTVKKSTVVTG
jgi:hypothetical protein